MKNRTVHFLLATAIAIGLLPLLLNAQSTISGAVTDSSGAIVPGVRVEASSPALIEKSRPVTTDGQGRYTIFDVRSGTYICVRGFPMLRTAALGDQSQPSTNPRILRLSLQFMF